MSQVLREISRSRRQRNAKFKTRLSLNRNKTFQAFNAAAVEGRMTGERVSTNVDKELVIVANDARDTDRFSSKVTAGGQHHPKEQQTKAKAFRTLDLNPLGNFDAGPGATEIPKPKPLLEVNRPLILSTGSPISQPNVKNRSRDQDLQAQGSDLRRHFMDSDKNVTQMSRKIDTRNMNSKFEHNFKTSHKHNENLVPGYFQKSPLLKSPERSQRISRRHSNQTEQYSNSNQTRVPMSKTDSKQSPLKHQKQDFHLKTNSGKDILSDHSPESAKSDADKNQVQTAQATLKDLNQNDLSPTVISSLEKPNKECTSLNDQILSSKVEGQTCEESSLSIEVSGAVGTLSPAEDNTSLNCDVLASNRHTSDTTDSLNRSTPVHDCAPDSQDQLENITDQSQNKSPLNSITDQNACTKEVPQSNSPNVIEESSRVTSSESTHSSNSLSAINSEIQEEMERAQNMSLPMNLKPKNISTIASNLNPSAGEFSPKLKDGFGNSFFMSSSRGVMYFRPETSAMAKSNVSNRTLLSAALRKGNEYLVEVKNVTESSSLRDTVVSETRLRLEPNSMIESTMQHTFTPSNLSTADYTNQHSQYGNVYNNESCSEFSEMPTESTAVDAGQSFFNAASLAPYPEYVKFSQLQKSSSVDASFYAFTPEQFHNTMWHSIHEQTPLVPQFGQVFSVTDTTSCNMPMTADPTLQSLVQPAQVKIVPAASTAFSPTGMLIDDSETYLTGFGPQAHVLYVEPSSQLNMQTPTLPTMSTSQIGMWSSAHLQAIPTDQTTQLNQNAHLFVPQPSHATSGLNSTNAGVGVRDCNSMGVNQPFEPHRFASDNLLNEIKSQAAQSDPNFQSYRRNNALPYPTADSSYPRNQGHMPRDTRERLSFPYNNQSRSQGEPRTDPATNAMLRMTADKLVRFLRTSSVDKLWSSNVALTDQDKSDIRTIQTLLGFLDNLDRHVPNMTDSDLRELLFMNLEALHLFQRRSNSAPIPNQIQPASQYRIASNLITENTGRDFSNDSISLTYAKTHGGFHNSPRNPITILNGKRMSTHSDRGFRRQHPGHFDRPRSYSTYSGSQRSARHEKPFRRSFM
ncbi:hypothetical protein Bpfe_015669 [Biomphalaria pfeifferi]|uniref:Uncharacterized protein n=1 Tax=Biomphalaria pfeifferi TaxID=112525 RepID=A0AAD8BHN4_BIOPF|nr:hypothetical protein Bpfe_015669 [Biomphalaria pfeifferi]